MSYMECVCVAERQNVVLNHVSVFSLGDILSRVLGGENALCGSECVSVSVCVLCTGCVTFQRLYVCVFLKLMILCVCVCIFLRVCVLWMYV